MILVNTDYISGKELKMLALVKGSTIFSTHSKHSGKGSAHNLRHYSSGELKTHTHFMNEAREIATNRMIDEAITLKADAIVNIRYESSSIGPNAIEVITYGTGVKFL